MVSSKNICNFVAIMKTTFKHIKTSAQKICALVLLFAFVFIWFAQVLHTHQNDTHCNNYQKICYKHNLNQHFDKTCHICQFTVNENSDYVLPTVILFNFKQDPPTFLLHFKYVAFYISKHRSHYSGSSPPLA